jgi:K+-sensing histidine kinase KdpD
MYFNTIVHDLKTPISVLILLNDLLKNTPYYKKNKIFRRITRRGEEAINTIYKMVSNILNIEKLNSGNFKSTKKSFNIRTCIKEALRIFKPAVPSERNLVKIKFNIPPAKNIKTDKDLYQHILYNLVANGKRFSPKDSPIEISVTLKNKILETSVRNKGSYIPKKYCNRIFDKFSQIRHKKTNLHNFGLGLTFCKAAIKYLQGTIWVESDREKNETTFSFSIPIE